MTRIEHGSGLGWFDTEKGALGGRNLRESIWSAVQAIKRQKRFLLQRREDHPEDVEGIAQREAELVQSEAELAELRGKVKDAWD